MRTNSIVSSLTILAAGAAFLLTPAAKATVPYADGDLLLGFRSASSNFDYIVDLGPDSNFMVSGANSGFGTGLYVGKGQVTLLSGASFATDLSTAGLTSGTFGLFGGDNTSTDKEAIFGTALESISGTQTNPQANPSVSGVLTPYSKLSGMGSTFKLGVDTLHGTNPNQTLGLVSDSVIQHIIADANPNTAPNNYSSFFTPLPAFGFFNTSAEGSYGSGSTSQVLDLYEFDAGAGGSGTLLGGLEIQANGSLVFDSNAKDFAPTPEPSTLAALIGGAGVFGFMRRRRNVVC